MMIEIRLGNNEANKKAIIKNLIANNAQKSPWLKQHGSSLTEHDFFIFADQQLIGGAVGVSQYNWYFLELLQINEAYQKQGLGRKLLLAIENFATAQNLTGIRMETWNFQARGFYEKLGYQVCGEIKDCPPGTVTYTLQKRLISIEN
ncbi:MAG: GNAT family N-acetyltransferase [Lactobacillaceae bacterium]|jgi:ribosomal protein S18 acetylase RimI-like enzyme|nr:GNAT family N-acetyltransferase [Lactobacillaceae bacterium]